MKHAVALAKEAARTNAQVKQHLESKGFSMPSITFDEEIKKSKAAFAKKDKQTMIDQTKELAAMAAKRAATRHSAAARRKAAKTGTTEDSRMIFASLPRWSFLRSPLHGFNQTSNAITRQMSGIRPVSRFARNNWSILAPSDGSNPRNCHVMCHPIAHGPARASTSAIILARGIPA